jgi:uncharacterized protein YyaL (SSP411 family)
MDEFAAETKVEWRKWGPEAFAVADRAGKPVLLALRASWCEDCHEMDRTTYADPRIAANVNDGFVPVRVDVDRNPRVRDRYNMGGFPSTVFTTPEGTVIAGATALGIDGFREILDGVRRSWDGQGQEAGSVPRGVANATPPGGEITTRSEEHMVEQLVASFDEEFGGWGTAVKFPLPRTVEFALVRARDQATRTLEAVRSRLTDTHDGGFFRFARNRNWSNPQREKLTIGNAALVRAFAHAYRYTGETAYRETAERGVEYLTTDLWTGEGFAASQGGDDAYYRLGATERAETDPPTVDETVFAGHNALAADALLTVVAYTDDERTRRYAQRALDAVRDRTGAEGAVLHYRAGPSETATAANADQDVAGGADGQAGLLVSQARALVGLTTAGSVLGDSGPARAVADYAIETLRSEAGAFRDGPAGGAGLLDSPLYPLDRNATLAHGLLDLWALTDDDRYRRTAGEALAAFAGATDRMGVEVADYASAVARVRDPQVLSVGVPAGADLHRAALRLADHETTVVPDDDRAPEGGAVVIVDGTATARASDPTELEGVLTGVNAGSGAVDDSA